MDKKAAIAAIRKARAHHIAWRAHAQAVMAGMPVKEAHLPDAFTDCEFGRWYYSEGQKLFSLCETFRAIEEPHQDLHYIYQQIFDILSGQTGQTTLEMLLGKPHKLSQDDLVQVQRLMPSFVHISQTLIEALSLLEAEIVKCPDEDFAAI